MLKNLRLRLLIAAMGISSIAVPALAQNWTDFGSITSLEAGWGADTIAIRLNAPFQNSFVPAPAVPGGARACTATNAGYATDPNDPGHSLYHTLAMAAFLNKKDVRLLLQGCVYDKPKIIAIQIR